MREAPHEKKHENWEVTESVKCECKHAEANVEGWTLKAGATPAILTPTATWVLPQKFEKYIFPQAPILYFLFLQKRWKRRKPLKLPEIPETSETSETLRISEKSQGSASEEYVGAAGVFVGF